MDRLGIDGVSKRERQGYYSAPNARLLPNVWQFAPQYGISPNAVALAFLLSHPFPILAVIGPRTVVQLRDSLATAKVELASADLLDLQHHRFSTML